VGRFQPFHNGHLLVVSGMAKVCDRVVIAIGSSQAEKSALNPFSLEERREMVQRTLQGENIIPEHDIFIIDVPDTEDNAAWTQSVLAAAGSPITEVWTGDAATKECFVASGVAVKDIKEVPGISGTIVRQQMVKGENWALKVPPAVADYLDTINGVERVKKIG